MAIQWIQSLSPLEWIGIALAAAFLLMVYGWVGRRVGSEPRCRRCGYELTELTSDRCPECGRPEVTKRPIRGVRRVRWVLVLGGAIALLVAIVPAVWIFQDSNWRATFPAKWLTMAVDFGDANATDEILNRALIRSLKESEVRSIVARGLNAQAYGRLGTPRVYEWMRLLDGLDQQDLLTDDEWERMILHLVRDVRLKARERSRVGGGLPLRLEVDWTAPLRSALSTELSVTDAAKPTPVGQRGKIYFSPEVGSQKSSYRTSMEVMLSAHRLAAGTLDVSFDLHGSYLPPGSSGANFSEQQYWPSQRSAVLAARFSLGGAAGAAEEEAVERVLAAGKPLPRVDLKLRQQVFIAAENSDDDCVPLTGEEVRKRLAGMFELRAVARRHGGFFPFTSGSTVMEPLLHVVGDAPWPTAFDVMLRQGDKRVYWGSIDAPANQFPLTRGMSTEVLKQLSAGMVMVELAPSGRIARRSMDLRYVKETIELGPVEVGERPPASSAPASAPASRPATSPASRSATRAGSGVE